MSTERGWNDPPDYLFQNNKTTTNNVPRLYRLYGKRQTPSALASATRKLNLFQEYDILNLNSMLRYKK